MNGVILQISMELDKWTGKANARYSLGQTLEDIWKLAGNAPGFITVGRDNLITHLKNKSQFKSFQSVQHLVKADFDPGAVITFSELLTKIGPAISADDSKSLALPNAMVDSFQDWLDGDKNITFFGATELSDLWKTKHSGSNFDSDGIQRLITAFVDAEFFEQWGSINESLKPEIFTNIKTVSSLYNFLKSIA